MPRPTPALSTAGLWTATAGLAIMLGVSGCLGTASSKAKAETNAPFDGADFSPAAVQPPPGPATSTSSPAPTGDPPAAPPPALDEPLPATPSLPPRLGLQELHFESPEARGPVAIELTLSTRGGQECQIATRFSASDVDGPTSRHILWRVHNGSDGRVGDVAFQDRSPVYAFGVGLAGTAVDRDFVQFPFGTVDQDATGPQEWRYLVAAADVDPNLGAPVTIDIGCPDGFQITGVRASREVWLLDSYALGVPVGVAGHAPLGQGSWAGASTYDFVLDVAANTSDATVWVEMPYGSLLKWTADPLTPGSLDFWHLPDGPGEYKLSLEATLGSVSILMASMFGVGSIDALDEALLWG